MHTSLQTGSLNFFLFFLALFIASSKHTQALLKVFEVRILFLSRWCRHPLTPNNTYTLSNPVHTLMLAYSQQEEAPGAHQASVEDFNPSPPATVGRSLFSHVGCAVALIGLCQIRAEVRLDAWGVEALRGLTGGKMSSYPFTGKVGAQRGAEDS